MSKDEYLAVARKIKAMIQDYNDLFGMIAGRIPKTSKTFNFLRSVGSALNKLYYQLETDFLNKFPDAEVNEYGK